jgi:hypothetical protein
MAVTNEDRMRYFKWAKAEAERKIQELKKEIWDIEFERKLIQMGGGNQDIDNKVIAYMMNKGIPFKKGE